MFLLCLESNGGLNSYGNEANLVTGPQLSQFPQVSGDHCRGTNKTTKRWSIRTENNRHITGKIHRAEGVSIIVNIGGMHSRFTARCARPLRFRTDQAHAGAAGVVVHFPIVSKKAFDVFVSKKIRCTVRAVNNAQLPVIGNLRQQRGGALGERFTKMAMMFIQRKHVASAQRAAVMSTELTERKRCFRREIIRTLNAARDTQIGSRTAFSNAAQIKLLTGRNVDYVVMRDRFAIQFCFDGRTSKYDGRGAREF